jgi:hypothetical protein
MEMPSWAARATGCLLGSSPTHSPDDRENQLWGAPKIHGELLKLGFDISETSVSKYLVRGKGSPSQSWKTFLENHVKSLVSVAFFTVPRFASKSFMFSL